MDTSRQPYSLLVHLATIEKLPAVNTSSSTIWPC